MKIFNRTAYTNTGRWAKTLAVTSSVLMLVACGGDSDEVTYGYDVTVTNLTHSQPLSPMGILFHDDEFSPWQIGEPASVELEDLAEGGDNSGFINQSSESIEAIASGNGLIMSGAMDSVSLEVTVNEGTDLNLSLATMLVNTNDAFAGVNTLSLQDLEVGETTSTYLAIYDAGTEGNSELAGTIPGPADGGEGTNPARDDVDYVARHPGVVGSDDGYTESTLDSTHTFDGPVAKLMIRRTQ